MTESVASAFLSEPEFRCGSESGNRKNQAGVPDAPFPFPLRKQEVLSASRVPFIPAAHQSGDRDVRLSGSDIVAKYLWLPRNARPDSGSAPPA